MSKQFSEDTESMRNQLAQRLREARTYAGLSQEEVAIALGIPRPAVTHFEAGTRQVEAVELAKLGTLYGQTTQYLLTGETIAEDGGRLAFLARATHGLSEGDLAELWRFAAILRSSTKSKRQGE
jgi:transcriptional regulator with XRE-family HTH domain